jgi:hypothetical protein
MKKVMIGLTVVWFWSVCSGQDEPRRPDCNSYVLQKVVNENPAKLNGKQRWCLYSGSIFTGQALFGSAFFAGVAQLRDDPTEWGQGTKGYLRRFGSRYAQGATKTTAEFVVGGLLHEDPRYQASSQKGIWKRTGHAVTTVFLAQHLQVSEDPAEQKVQTRLWPNFSKMAGAGGSGLIGYPWYPSRLNTPGQVAARVGSAYGGYVASAVFQEFQGDVFHLIGLAFGSDRGSPSQSRK